MVHGIHQLSLNHLEEKRQNGGDNLYLILGSLYRVVPMPLLSLPVLLCHQSHHLHRYRAGVPLGHQCNVTPMIQIIIIVFGLPESRSIVETRNTVDEVLEFIFFKTCSNEGCVQVRETS